MKTNGIDRYLMLADEIGIVYFIVLLSQHARNIGAVAFLKPTIYYESLQGSGMRRSLEEERKRFINDRWLFRLLCLIN